MAQSPLNFEVTAIPGQGGSGVRVACSPETNQQPGDRSNTKNYKAKARN